MLVLATANFEAYHAFVTELRNRGVTFTSVEPTDALPEDATIVLATPGDDLDALDTAAVTVVRAEAAAPRAAVERAISLLRDEDGRTVIGVDPGDRPGIAVLVGNRVVAAFQVPRTEAAEVIHREAAEAVDPLVRVGDGARLAGAQLVEELDGLPVELVDETGTTPHLGAGARGSGDIVAAINIALQSGERTDTVDIEPTAGEIQVIQNRSRERTGSETLPTELARAVAVGDLDLEEAIARHRDRRDG
ncbi:MAG: hypothetical protein ABEJ35_06815 [Halobacteriaceae archaeon]